MLVDKGTDDAHDNPTLQIDEEGYLWAFSNAHGSVLTVSFLFLLVFLFATSLAGCRGDRDRLFKRRSPRQTVVHFANTIAEDDTLMNPLDFLYIYNGWGVGIGDANNDGRRDLYFAGNQVKNRLYLNQGNFQFDDVTKAAGVGADRVWSTGIAMVDVNQDGLLDIYVSAGGPPEAGTERANRLFVNQGLDADGVPSFKEQAKAYGIANAGYTTQAAFFDSDKDGDLDLYVLNNAMQDGNQNAFDSRRTEGQAKNTDHFYRNNGDGTFSDISAEAGMQIEGYGLGIGITDINKDGWPDVYVANDFVTNDLLYVNNGDGTFTNRIGEFLKHRSYSAMGVDLADFNNDARVDILTLDMLPPTNRRLRMMPKAGGYEVYQRARRLGYQLQHVRNALQLNHGRTPEGHYTLSDISHLAGVHATDWSWAPLFADFDNDGDRDLFVTNGYGEDVTNLDYTSKQERMMAFGSDEAKRKELLEAMKALPEVNLPNRFFMNQGPGSGDALRFTDKTGHWASRKPGISNGAAFADLDSDGDLDLVTNNTNAKATLLENTLLGEPNRKAEDAHWVRIRLHGPTGNRAGFGAKVTLHNDGSRQYHDHSTFRGYQSSVEPVIHFGLGADSTADSLEVAWPDGTQQGRTNLTSGQVVNVRYEEDSQPHPHGHVSPPANDNVRDSPYLFREVAADRGLDYEHEESGPTRSDENPLLPHLFSQNGPGVAVGDVNGDGRDDVYAGGDRGQKGALFVQTEPGQFVRRPLPMKARYDDMGALFFDAEGDGDMDLYVVSGGSAGAQESSVYQDRLYVNDGTGHYRRASRALPQMGTSGSVVTAADYDADGDLDLLVGGRVLPGDYPLPPRSHLLHNDLEEGNVAFTDVTVKQAPALTEVGLVTDALWTDHDGDSDRDLMVVGEWMPVTLFENDEGRLTEITTDAGFGDTSGWWNGLTAGDFDRDGDVDYVAGNLGLNTKYQASPSEPVRIHAKDFDENGDLDPVLSRYLNGTSYPAHSRDAMVEQIPGMKSRFSSYRSYAEAPFEEVFTDDELDGAYVRNAADFETSYLENRRDTTFDVRPLPVRTQTAPVFGMESGDYDGDGFLDLLLIGNWYATHATIGRADAFVGALLTGDGTGHFDYVNYTESGFLVDGDGKGLAEVTTGSGTSLVIAAQNGGRLKAFARPNPDGSPLQIRPDDRRAELHFADGAVQTEELYFGSSYLSQSSRALQVPTQVETVVIHQDGGTQRTVRLDSLQASAPQTATSAN